MRSNASTAQQPDALMSYRIGEDLARQFGEAHESDTMLEHPESTKMDLHNNEIGYEIVRKPILSYEISKQALTHYAKEYETFYSTGDWQIYIIIDRAYNALLNGSLIYLR